MIGRNSIVKKVKKSSEHSAKNSLPLSRNRQTTKMISLSYDVDYHVYSKSTSV